MNELKCCVDKAESTVAKQLMTRPLAVFSIVAFVFSVARLYVDVEHLLLPCFLLGLVLIVLKARGKITVFVAVFVFSASLLGMYVTSYKIDTYNRLSDRFDNRYARVEGVVSTIKGENGLYVDTTSITDTATARTKSMKVYIKSKDAKGLEFGDKITFNALLRKIDKNSKYGKIHLAKGVRLAGENVEIIGINRSDKDFVSKIRNKVLKIGDTLKFEEARMLFKGLIAGDKTSFSKNLTNNLSKSGLSHIAAVSGLHVSLVGMAVFNIFRRLSRRTGVFVSLAAVILFAAITGNSPSTMRATLMFGIYMSAKLFSAESDSFTSLCFSATVLMLYNPFIVFDWGFILSYLSVLGIQTTYPLLREKTRFLPGGLSESVSVTLSAQLMTAPALINMFGSVSLYAVAANIVVSALFLPTLYCCILYTFVSGVPGVKTVVGLITSFLLKAITSSANLFADLPASTIKIDGMETPLCIIYYIVILIFVLRDKMPQKLQTAIACASTGALILYMI